MIWVINKNDDKDRIKTCYASLFGIILIKIDFE